MIRLRPHSVCASDSAGHVYADRRPRRRVHRESDIEFYRGEHGRGSTDGGVTPEQIRSALQQRSTVRDVFTLLDTDRNGSVSLQEMIGFCDGSVDVARPGCGDFGLRQVLLAIGSEMALGAGGENVPGLPAVQFGAIGSSPAMREREPGPGQSGAVPHLPRAEQGRGWRRRSRGPLSRQACAAGY